MVKIRGAQIAAFAAIGLAITNVASPLIYQAGTNPSTVLMLRGLATSLIIAVILALSGRLRFLRPKDEFSAAVSGFLFMLAGYVLLNALQIAPVSIVVLILYFFPLLTTIFDAIARRSLPSKLTVILMLIALFGLALALDAVKQNITLEGMALAFLAAVSASATMVWGNHKLADVDPEQITLRMFIVGFLIFAGLVWYEGSFELPPTNQGMIYLIALLICFAVSFLAMFRASQMAGAVNASMIMNLEPVFTIFLSVLILSETLTLKAAIGTIIVLAAVLASQIFSNSKAKSVDFK